MNNLNYLITKSRSPLLIYNTLHKQKEEFQSLVDRKVKMYVCGPTVYNFLHIGNFRGPIFFNLVASWLKKRGNQVDFVFNYTDVDDKIIAASNKQNISALEYGQKYIEEFEKDFSNLKLTKHTCNPKVSDHIEDIIILISKLIKNEKAYVIEGEVFFETSKFEPYGKLSGTNLQELEQGKRVNVDQRKRHPSDFVLWKPAKNAEIFWKSPWGNGRPGWHIECSAMIHAILGEQIDIHGGGIDLIFPHHENEIAQSEGATGRQYCKYWMHNEFINLDNTKMSKSIGNVITGRDFMTKYHPEILKYLFLSAHYRSILNINDDKIHSTFSSLDRIYRSIQVAQNIIKLFPKDNMQIDDTKINKTLQAAINKANKNIIKALNDDFNTPEALAQIFVVIRVFNEQNFIKKLKDVSSFNSANLFLYWIKEWGEIFSLFNENATDFLYRLDDIVLNIAQTSRTIIDSMLEDRNIARQEKNFEKSDKIRDELNKKGVIILDASNTSSWTMDKNKF